MRKTERNLARFQIAVALALLTLFAVPSDAAEPAGSERWEFDLTVYVWLPTIEGKLNYDIPGSDDMLEIDVGTILEDLKMTGMLAFGARKNRWSAFADVIYLDMADGKDSSVPLSIGSDLELDVGAQLELKSWVVGMAGA